MTTIIGIKASYGLEGVVFCSDTQLSGYDEDDELVEIWKNSNKKIIHGNRWMMGDAGIVEKKFSSFLSKMASPKKYGWSNAEAFKVISTAVVNYKKGETYEKPHFKKINDYNTLACRVGEPMEDLHRLIIAANIQKEIEMWYVDEFGNLKQPQKKRELEYLVIGSGADNVDDYFNGTILAKKYSNKFDQKLLDIPTAIDLVVGAMKKAEEDPGTSGLDLTILTKKGVTEYGKEIRDALAETKKREIETIKGMYR